MNIIKNSEKVLIWLHREKKTQKWLSDKLGKTRQDISNKINNNSFTNDDINIIRSLGCNL